MTTLNQEELMEVIALRDEFLRRLDEYKQRREVNLIKTAEDVIKLSDRMIKVGIKPYSAVSRIWYNLNLDIMIGKKFGFDFLEFACF